MTAGLHFEPDSREILRTAMNWIFNQPPAGLPFAFLEAIDTISDNVEGLTRDSETADLQAWHRAAVATKAILRDHSEDVKAEFLEAFADLPPMEWPGSD